MSAPYKGSAVITHLLNKTSGAEKRYFSAPMSHARCCIHAAVILALHF